MAGPTAAPRASGLRVVAIEAILSAGPAADAPAAADVHVLASGLALCAPGGAPLVLTTADFEGTTNLTVAFRLRDGATLALPARVAAVVPVRAAEDAFSSMAWRGWRCSSPQRTGPRRDARFRLHLLRTDEVPVSAEDSLEDPSPAAWDAMPEEAWVGTRVRVLASPFGPAAPISRTVTRGLLSNVSTPPGLLLLDARCMEASAGAGVLLDETGHMVACMAPLLRSSSKETVEFSIAIPLLHVADALLEDGASVRSLRPEELAALAPQPGGPGAPAPDVGLAAAVRRGVVMLWVESTGSWASAVVVSRAGHLVTCAHLLTGCSWMEAPAGDEASEQPAAPRRPPRQPPKRCRGRGQVLAPGGGFVEAEFQAEVLHVAEGCLDAALLLVRNESASAWPSLAAASGGGSQGLEFEPLEWRRDPPPEATEVFAVGHGLFGPGTPWRGPSVTVGHVAKVAMGLKNRRPAILQSTAAVHRGCSGGALVEAAGGALLGLVTTNVKQQDGAVMPHVNFSLPTALLEPLREFLDDPSRPGALDTLAVAWKLCAADEQEQSLWRLEPEPLYLPSRMEERKQQALEKMERLAEDAKASEVDGADDETASPGRAPALEGGKVAGSAPPLAEGRRPEGAPPNPLHRSAL